MAKIDYVDLATMRYRGSFSYINDNRRVVRIDNNTKLKIESLGQGVASNYFVNRHDRSIQIPNGFTLWDIVRNANNGVEVLALRNPMQQQQSLEGVDWETEIKDLSETVSLQELNSKLIAIIAELRKENAEIKTENTKLKAENIKVKAKNEKLNQTLEEHESRFIKLEQNDKDTATENDELKSRVTKLEQQLQNNSDNIDTNPKTLEDGTKENNKSLVVAPCKPNTNNTLEQINLQSDDTPASNVSDISSNSDKFNNAPNSNISFENKEIKFLEQVHKEHIINEIRERKREKKLLQNDEAPHNQDPVSYNKDNSSCVIKTVTVETFTNSSHEQNLIQEINHAIKTEVNNIHPNCDNIRILANNVRPNCDNSEIIQNCDNFEITQDIICLYQNACSVKKDAIEANQNKYHVGVSMLKDSKTWLKIL
ncbi:crinkler family protein [Gigaspora margarita]|uniref:Crinkler family protein n=1 Tax=Gigaspora margarita TaxID=4874 RepID=A0A8H4AIL4_GIGMA|nr:crinkler family protein [Gigaspora margarita]